MHSQISITCGSIDTISFKIIEIKPICQNSTSKIKIKFYLRKLTNQTFNGTSLGCWISQSHVGLRIHCLWYTRQNWCVQISIRLCIRMQGTKMKSMDVGHKVLHVGYSACGQKHEKIWPRWVWPGLTIGHGLTRRARRSVRPVWSTSRIAKCPIRSTTWLAERRARPYPWAAVHLSQMGTCRY